jgi:hypothetical protein
LTFKALDRIYTVSETDRLLEMLYLLPSVLGFRNASSYYYLHLFEDLDNFFYPSLRVQVPKRTIDSEVDYSVCNRIPQNFAIFKKINKITKLHVSYAMIITLLKLSTYI